MVPLLRPCSDTDRVALAAQQGGESGWFGPGQRLLQGDRVGRDGWRRTFTIGARAGFLQIDAERHPAGMLGVLTIWVRPDRRRQGLARAAVGEILTCDLRLDCVQALIFRSNTAALALFASAGFTAARTDRSGRVILQRHVGGDDT